MLLKSDCEIAFYIPTDRQTNERTDGHKRFSAQEEGKEVDVCLRGTEQIN